MLEFFHMYNTVKMPISERFKSTTFYVFHFVLGCCGVLMVSFAIVYRTIQNNGIEIIKNGLLNFVISIGVIQLIFCALGSLGVAIKHKFLLLTSNVMMNIVIGTMTPIYIIALVTVHSEDFPNNVTVLLEKNDDIHFFEQKFECCGVNGSGYYNIADAYPATCCKNLQSPCIEPFDEGCAAALIDLIGTHLNIIGYLSLTNFAIGLALIVFYSVIRCVPWTLQAKNTKPANMTFNKLQYIHKLRLLRLKIVEHLRNTNGIRSLADAVNPSKNGH